MISYSQTEFETVVELSQLTQTLFYAHRTEMIFIYNVRATFCAKHDFTVTKSTHAIKLLCKNVVETLNYKDFFSILPKYFLILKQFSWFWNIFLNSEIFFSIPYFFSRFHNFFWLWNIFVDSNFFFSILKVFCRWRLSATIIKPTGKAKLYFESSST